MRHLPLALLLLLLLFSAAVRGQAVFQSSSGGTGNWNDPASWTLVSGSTSSSYPVSGDTATISAAAAITVNTNAQCNQLTINGGSSLLFNSTGSILTVSNGLSLTGASTIDLSLGVLAITGNATIGGASTITVNQGAFTVIGLLALNSPTSAGTTLLDIEGGAFSCLGGMTVTATTLPAGRMAELRIGGGAVNLVGGLVTLTANARINFTGAGTLTLAGVISIGNNSSFIAGNGRVIYFGIPGSNQTIAPLTYYRLVISGAGSGLKQINGAVAVTDSLTLLTDTLLINGGGSLALSDGITIIRTAGQLLSPPTFLGAANLVYNDISRDTTGAEMPLAAGVLQNLTISDIGGVQLGSAVTVNAVLSLQQGPLITDPYSLTISNPAGGAGVDPAINRTNGWIAGKLSRAIGNTAGLRIFPLGIAVSGYRELELDYTTAPTAGGTITAWAIDSAAPAQSGLPLTDGSVTVSHTAPMYWQADAGGGLSGGVYTMALTGGGAPGVSDVNTLRIVKRPSTGGDWVLDGTDGAHAGTSSAPVIGRTGMSGFSQFSFGSDNTNTLPVTLVSFTGKVEGYNVLLSWTSAAEENNLSYTVEESTDGQLFGPIGTVAGAGTSGLVHAYSYNYAMATAGLYYFRLKQTDLDGRSSYSIVISGIVKASASVVIYPNPATSWITVDTPGGSIVLLDASGKYLRALSPGLNNVSQLANGIYYIRYGNKLFPFIKN